MHISEADLLTTLMAATLFVCLISVFFVFIIVNNYKKNLTKHLEDIRLIYHTQEEERDRIAKELHDGIGSLLSAAKLHTGLLEGDSSREDISETARNISGIIDKAVSDLRTMVLNLVPRNLEESGWIAELHHLESQINYTKKQKIHISCNDPGLRFKPETEINLYRIVQELVNNSVKHSGGTEINVDIVKKDEGLVIEFSDNGCGFNSGEVKMGHGMKNIQTRLNACNGTMAIAENESRGTRFTLFFENGKLAG